MKEHFILWFAFILIYVVIITFYLFILRKHYNYDNKIYLQDYIVFLGTSALIFISIPFISMLLMQ